jgi:hypothetical protein
VKTPVESIVFRTVDPLEIVPPIAPGALARLILLTPAGRYHVPLLTPLEIVRFAGAESVTMAYRLSSVYEHPVG